MYASATTDRHVHAQDAWIHAHTQGAHDCVATIRVRDRVSCGKVRVVAKVGALPEVPDDPIRLKAHITD